MPRYLGDVARLGLVGTPGRPRWVPVADFPDPPPGGIRFRRVRVRANKALSPAELEDRLVLYARRAARCSSPRYSVECWACGKQAPVRTAVARFGWVARVVEVAGSVEYERYCDRCITVWGWPP